MTTSPLTESEVTEALTIVLRNVFELSVVPHEVGHDVKPDMVGVVGIAGERRGIVAVRVTEILAGHLADQMLGDESHSIADINDVIGEFANILAGKIKDILWDTPDLSRLSLPTIVRGQQLNLESISHATVQNFGYECLNQPLVIEIYLSEQE